MHTTQLLPSRDNAMALPPLVPRRHERGLPASAAIVPLVITSDKDQNNVLNQIDTSL